MRKIKAAFWLLTIALLVYCIIGIKYSGQINFNTYETIGTVIAFLWVVPAWVTMVDGMAS